MIKLYASNNSEIKEILTDENSTLQEALESAGYPITGAILSHNGKQFPGNKTLRELGAEEGDNIAAVVKNTGSFMI